MKETHFEPEACGTNIYNVTTCAECNLPHPRTINHIFGSHSKAREEKLIARGLVRLPKWEVYEYCEGHE